MANSELPTAIATSAPNHKRKFSNYLLNKSLQLRYMIFVASLSTIISGVLGYMIWQQEHRASAEILQTFDSFGEDDGALADIQREVEAQLTAGDSRLVLKMVGVGIGLVLVLSLYLLMMTHKVAGPLYKVSGYFDKMAEGKLGDTYALRRGDMLQDFYAEFRDMHVQVRERFQADHAVVENFLATCDKNGIGRDGALGHALDELAGHQKGRAEALS